MDEKYNNITKEAEELFDSIQKDSLLVQKDTLYEGYPMNPTIKHNIEVCVTDNTWSYGIIEEFENIKHENEVNPLGTQVWGPILSKYTPTLVGECQKVIDWSNGLVKQWLMDNMFDGIPNADDKADNVVENIGSHALTKSHSRHLHIDYLRNLGLNITALEDDAKLQDKVLDFPIPKSVYKFLESTQV